jgi:hypothetical protein
MGPKQEARSAVAKARADLREVRKSVAATAKIGAKAIADAEKALVAAQRAQTKLS